MSQYRKLMFINALGLLTACGSQEVTVARHAADGEPVARVVFLAGPDSHGPGAHEHKSGTELLSAALRERDSNYETVNVYGGWPEDPAIFDGVDALVMYCDGGKHHLINEQLQAFNRIVEQGVGVVALHYCVEVPRSSPSADAMLNAIGGYFETDWSVNPHWMADFVSLPEHPVTVSIVPFSMQDEWYFNMRFRERGVTDILSAVAPESTMSRRNGPHSGNDAVRRLVAEGVPQVTAWAYERQGGGRGFGYTGGHFHNNWQNESARNLVLNAIEWAAGD